MMTPLLVLLCCVWGIYALNRDRAFDEAIRKLGGEPEPVPRRRYHADWLEKATRGAPPAPPAPTPRQTVKLDSFTAVVAYLLNLPEGQRRIIVEALAPTVREREQGGPPRSTRQMTGAAGGNASGD